MPRASYLLEAVAEIDYPVACIADPRRVNYRVQIGSVHHVRPAQS